MVFQYWPITGIVRVRIVQHKRTAWIHIANKILSINQYQRKDSSLMSKLTCVKYKRYSFCGGWNTINLIIYNHKIVITDKIQKYVVKWYHMYLHHPGWYRTDSIIHQFFTGLELDAPFERKSSFMILSNVKNGQLKIW